MRKRKLKVIIFVILIVALLAVCIIIGKNMKKGKKENSNTNVNSTVEEFVKVEQDGTKTNVSNQLKKEKTIDGMIIKDITIETKNNETILQAIVENPTNQTKGDYGITLKIKDKLGNVIKEISGYINTTNPKSQTKLKIKTSYDFANAYDFEIMK